ncbi:MAG: excinuclease ABC subunit UvrC [Alphaproteobacteria bacterium]|nr:excinuclease ABC subunit UvrC [Alphaproteobacteria bacterium]
MPNIQHGIEVIKNNVKIAPLNPGVYRMLDKNGKVLYVGKAKSIKKRIVAYTHFEKLPDHIKRMVSEVDKMEFIIVENEAKALLMENDLIKKLEPKYNILLKDDKTFPHLMINLQEEFPALRKSRGARKDKSRYFGPFANATAVNNVMDMVQKTFRLRSCRDSVFHNRERPCMLYQIKRCSAPCVGKISSEEYRKTVDEVVRFLEGKNTSLQAELSQQMQEASAALDFETALVLRDRIRSLSSVQSGYNVEYADINSADVVAVKKHKNMVCVQVFFVRGGQNCGNIPYFPKQAQEMSEEEILEGFLSTFYAEHQAPKEILVSHKLENSDFLEQALDCKINFYQRGNKAKIIVRAVQNAEAAIERKLAETATVEANLYEMQRVFGLPCLPQRIEIYDNSHNQGSYAVGAMVVATPSGFDKKSYRTFNIKYTENTNDDFAMMKEVLLRRFERMSDENRPDVILLDGGLGQLHAVHEVLQNYDLNGITIIAISKGPERNAGKEFYHIIGRESFSLPFQSSIAFYMQNLRDEAHRFAIGTHRKKRAKSIYKSQIDDIEGIGAGRKHDLLNFFGSVEQIKSASVQDLMKVSGINKKIAEKIYNYFHN